MKKTLRLLSLAALTIGLLASCSKINERIDGLDKRINNLENDKIASVEQQISAINQSISDLGTIRQNIQNLIDTTDGQEKDINSLKTADASLGQRIDELKAYTDETLKAYAKSDWVKATFATLEQHEWTCDTVAKIDARIGKLDKKLSESIKDSEESLRSWVNAQMESYYTAAQMDAKVAELLSEIATASGESQAKADSLAKELKEAKSAIATVKTELTEAYQSAIEKAIKTSEGKLTSKISSSVSSVNSKVSALADRVGDLEDEVNDLTDRIEDLEGRIQSVTIIPAYSDGGVMEKDGTLTVDFVVSPASALENVTKDDIKVLVNTVKTKAATFKTVPAATATINESNGEVTITADISSIQVEEDKALTVAINVKNGISDYTTNFVPVYTPASAPATFKAVLDADNTLTFYYDAIDYSGDGITVYDDTTNYLFDDTKSNGAKWGYNGNRSSITSVVIDASVADYKGLTRTAYMFYGMTYASSISGAEHLDVSNVTDMSSMFSGFGFSSNSLTDIPNVTDWQTGNVTNMNSLFYGYGIGSGSLAEVPDVSNWNTAKVKNMSNMFNQYGKSSTVLTKVPIVNGSNWDTGEVTNMSGMFQNYGYTSEVLVEVPDVSEWNTAKVEDMSNMFYGYAYHSEVLTKVPTVNGSNWDTKAVTNMSCMFQEYGYTSTDLKAVPQVGNWNTEIVTKMGKMFYNYGYCSVSLAEVPDVSNWNTASVTDMSYMFNSFAHNSTALTIVPRVDGSNWKTENLKDIDYMFQYYGNSAENICCELDLSGWNLANLSEGEGSNVFNFEPINFNVTIPAKTGDLVNEVGKWYYGNGTNSIAPPAGKTFTLPAPPLPAVALLGEFSVSATKKVHFSKGNLYAKKESEEWKWHFYDEQYKFLAADMEKSGSTDSPQREVQGSETEIHLFTWGYDNTSTKNSYSLNPINTAGITGHDTEGNKQLNPSTGGDDWGVAYCNSNNITVGTWRTLSKDEWTYLFNTRTGAVSKVGYATVGGVKGIIILPDNFTDPMKNNDSDAFVPKPTESEDWDNNVYSESNWNAMETAGAVFLPAAGGRNGSDVHGVGGYGLYWSATADDGSDAYYVDFDRDDVGPDSAHRYGGFSVRLITDVK